MRKRPTRTPPHLTRPDLTPLAGVWLLLSFFFVLIYRPAEPRPGLVALHETPRVGCGCQKIPDHTRMLVCLTADGRTSFTTSDAALQAASLRQAGWLTGQQKLSDTQLLTCIATVKTLSPSMTQLPAYLYLAIDANTNSTTVMHLLHLLQRPHLNRVNLLVHCRV